MLVLENKMVELHWPGEQCEFGSQLELDIPPHNSQVILLTVRNASAAIDYWPDKALWSLHQAM